MLVGQGLLPMTNVNLIPINNGSQSSPTKAQEELPISEMRYRRLFEAARDGILILDARTRKIIDVNPFMVELLGYTRDEFLGKELWEIGLLKDAQTSAAAFKELQKIGYIRYDNLPLQTKGGQGTAVEFVSNVYEENERQVIQCNIRDITARKTVEAVSARLAAIVESSHDGIISKTLDGIITTWNAGAQKLFGYTAHEAIGRPSSFLVPSDLSDEVPQLLDKIRRGESVEHYETVRVRKDGSRVDISLSISPLRDETGNIVGASAIKRDITQHKRREAELRERAEFQRTLLENFPNGSVNVFDHELRYVLAAGRGLEQIGMVPEQLIGKTLEEVFLPEQAALVTPYYQRALDGETVEFELALGNRLYNISAAPLRIEGKTVFNIIAVAQEITERKMAEQALAFSGQQLRALAQRLESVQEEQRGNIARELHDELGQVLSALRINLSTLGQEWGQECQWLGEAPDNARSSPDLSSDQLSVSATSERIEALLQIVDGAIQSVRRICLELRPRVLDDLGLAAAIEWQVHQFQKHAGIRCRLVSTGKPLKLDAQRSATVFRILQEALTNVMRHARASRVKVSFHEKSGSFILEVQDNGRGITTNDMTKMTSLGLLGMQERARLLGGTVSVEGQAGKGTLVQMRIPVEAEQ